MKIYLERKQMKTFLIAGAVVAFTSTAALSQEAGKTLTIDGDVSYSVEKQLFTTEVGPTTSLMGLTIEPRAHMTMDNDLDFKFIGVSTKATYGLSSNMDVYATITADKDFKYEDINVGVAFSF